MNLNQAMQTTIGNAAEDHDVREAIVSIDPTTLSLAELRGTKEKVAEALAIRRSIVERASATIPLLETLGASVDAELARRTAEGVE